MTSLLDPTLLYDTAYGILAAAESAITDGDGEEITRSFVAPGTVGLAAWDDCCGGQLIVGIEEVYLGDPLTFASGALPTRCASGTWFARYVAQIARCHPTIDENGVQTGDAPMAVPAADLATTAALTLTDAWAMMRGVQCYLGTILDNDDFLLGSLTPNGPSGNCVAYDLRVTLNLGSGCPCPPEP